MTKTDEFCATFQRRSDFIGEEAANVVADVYPEGVDRDDVRLKHIRMLCMVGKRLPACRTCRGTGFFAIGMTRDFCGDCEGTGIEHPADAPDDVAKAAVAAALAPFRVKFKCWQSECSTTVQGADRPPPSEPGTVLAYEIEAVTWREAMEEHHRRQGWEPYRCDDPIVDEPMILRELRDAHQRWARLRASVL